MSKVERFEQHKTYQKQRKKDQNVQGHVRQETERAKNRHHFAPGPC